MKTNKKAVLGFAVAMVFSLAFMQGNSMKSNKQNIALGGYGATLLANHAASEGNNASAAAWGLVSTVGYNLAWDLGVTGGWTGVGLIGAGVLAL